MADENFQDSFDVPDFNEDIPSEDGMDEEQAEAPQMVPQPVPQPRMRQRPIPPRRQQQRQPMTPQQAVSQAAPMPQQQQQQPQQQAIQQAQPVQSQPASRFIPYEIPGKVGLLDRTTGKPIIEDENTNKSDSTMLRVIMAQLADIRNEIEELKAQLYSG